MAGGSRGIAAIWWNALVRPEDAGRLVLGLDHTEGFTRSLTAGVAVLYAIYGASMGAYLGPYPALISAIKLPFLYLCSLAVCFPPLYVLNAGLGPRLTARQCLRMLLLAMSANAAALASYALVALFFSVTTSHEDSGYGFLVLMHVGVFGTSGLISLAVIAVIFRATGRLLGRPIRPLFILLWGLLYGIVGTQCAWVLRPWIGAWNQPYEPFREMQGSFFESVWELLKSHVL